MIGSILGAFGIAAAAVRLLTPLVAAHLREWAILVGAMAATAILFGIYPLMHAPLAMGVCSVLLGFTLGSVQPMVMSLLHQLAPEHRYGEAVAMRVIVINTSSVSIPMVSGVAGSLIGAAGVFWAAGLMVGAGVRLALGLRHHVDDRGPQARWSCAAMRSSGYVRLPDDWRKTIRLVNFSIPMSSCSSRSISS